MVDERVCVCVLLLFVLFFVERPALGALRLHDTCSVWTSNSWHFFFSLFSLFFICPWPMVVIWSPIVLAVEHTVPSRRGRVGLNDDS